MRLAAASAQPAATQAGSPGRSAVSLVPAAAAAAAAAVPPPRRLATGSSRVRAAASSRAGWTAPTVADSAAVVPPSAALGQPVLDRAGLAYTSGASSSSSHTSSWAGPVATSQQHAQPPAQHHQEYEPHDLHPQQNTEQQAQQLLPAAHIGTLWGLALMTCGYLHFSITAYALPSLLPIVTENLQLTDTQGGLITTGYTILYGLALVPMGLLADSVNRPRLLAGGIAVWSLLTMTVAQSQSFGVLMASRLGLAIAQGVQNPVSYSLIPELFPNHRTAAMSFYNTAIYVGRGLTYAVVILAGQQVAAQGDIEAWRPLVWWLGVPGLITAALAWLTLEEPRQRSSEDGRFLPLMTLSQDYASSDDEVDFNFPPMSPVALASAAAAATYAKQPAHLRTMVVAPESVAPANLTDRLEKLKELLANPAFQALTAASAINDVASWALIGWQSTLYARVFELDASVYGPLIAMGIGFGGIAGGIGSALFGDKLTSKGARGWLTGATSVAAAPLVAASFLVPDYRLSFATLLVGYALSECWRAPAAVMVREVSPPGLGSTASAVHLCIRGLAGALGPIGVAYLSGQYGLQMAMLLIPGCHVVAGLGLAATEGVIKAEKAKAAQHAE